MYLIIGSYVQMISQKFIIKSVTDNNITIAGYASVYNVVDQQNDMVIKGAFANTDNQVVKFLWQHNIIKPIGVIKALHEDNYGLQIEAIINSNIQSGREAIELVQQGSVDGLSIGFNLQSAYYNHLGQRVVEKAELLEISIVTFPANAHAKIYNINNANQQEHMNTEAISSENTEQITKQIKILEDRINNIQTVLARPELGNDNNNIEYKAAFGDYLRKGRMDVLIQKSLSSAAGEGDVLLVPTLYHKIISEMKARSPMRQLASVETISTNALDVVIEDGKFTSGWIGDAERREDTETPKLKQKRILVHELYAQPKATQVLIDDSAIQIEDWLVERLRDSFIKVENAAFINGSGEKQPKGILHEDHQIKTINVGDFKLQDLLLNLINDLDEEYLTNASFLMNRTTLSTIQQLKDENGRFIWQQTFTESLSHTIFGIPVVCCAEMPSIEEGKRAIAFGDFSSAYKIVDRSGVNIMRDQYTEKPFIKFYTVKRVGGDIVNPEALRFAKF
jgi:HK97 family phage major capsid protein